MTTRPWPEEAERLRRIREEHEANVAARMAPECEICGVKGGHAEYCVNRRRDELRLQASP